MRPRQLRALVLSLILTFVFTTFPVTAAAAPRCNRDGWLDRELPFIGKVIKHIRKTFRAGTEADTLTLPTP